MDKRRLIYENKKVLKKIEETNKKVGEKKSERIAEEEAIVLKDSINYLGMKIPKNLKDAEKKIDEVIDYHRPRWVKREDIKKTVFFISSKDDKKKVKYDINEFYRKLYGIK